MICKDKLRKGGVVMSISTVSSKGQITLPAEARRAVGIRPHDRVFIDVRAEQIVVQPVEDFFKLDGFLGKPCSRKKELADMMRGVSTHVEVSR